MVKRGNALKHVVPSPWKFEWKTRDRTGLKNKTLLPPHQYLLGDIWRTKRREKFI